MMENINTFDINLTNNTTLVEVYLLDVFEINGNGASKTYSLGFVKLSTLLFIVSFLSNTIVLYLCSKENRTFMNKIKALDCVVSRS